MLTEDRFRKILEMVERDLSVTVMQLTKELDTSEATIRRDLIELDKQGLLVKVRGGAVSAKETYATKDETVSVRQTVNLKEKQRIARYAAELIEPGDFVYIDAGTTTGLMIDYITEKDVTFVTNAISHAKKLTERGFDVYILGGQFKLSTEAIVGEEALEGLKKYNFTKGFYGVNGVNTDNGFTTPDVQEAAVKKESIKHCRKPFVLADKSKFSQISSVTFGNFEGAVIITDSVNEKMSNEHDNIITV